MSSFQIPPFRSLHITDSNLVGITHPHGNLMATLLRKEKPHQCIITSAFTWHQGVIHVAFQAHSWALLGATGPKLRNPCPKLFHTQLTHAGAGPNWLHSLISTTSIFYRYERKPPFTGLFLCTSAMLGIQS